MNNKNLTPKMLEAILRISKRGVTAPEIGAEGIVLRRLEDHGLLIGDHDGKPAIYHLSDAGSKLVAEMTRTVRPTSYEGDIARIQRVVAHHFKIPVIEMISARRGRAVARPRQIAMWLAKQTTTQSLPDIGRRFGGRDHTTIIHGVRKVEALRSQDAAFDHDVTTLLDEVVSANMSSVVDKSDFSSFADISASA
jgi:DNA-binding PadR family transcriptional regulator